MPDRKSYAHGEFCWVDYNAHDMNAAIEFYGSLFGWEAAVQDTHGGPPYAMFTLGGGDVGGIGQMSDEMKAQGIPPMWNSYVHVDDIDAAAAQAEQLGATIAVPVMPVMDAGRLCFFQDPQGAMVALWQPGRHCGAAVKDEPNAFCWNELYTRDFEGAKKFYADLFGWTYEPNPHSPTPDYAVIKVGDVQTGGIMKMGAEMDGVPPHWAVYFKTADAESCAEKIKQLGGTVMHGPFEVPQVCRLAIAADAQGGSFNVIQMLQEP